METNSNISFKDMIDASAMSLSSGGYLSIIDILVALTASLICSLVIILVYRRTFSGVIFQKSFNLSIVLLALVSTSVIMVISGNLILSLGMVGALSIIRFRAAIKDPLDIIYMFWAITIGIANGVAFFKLSFFMTIFVSIVLLLLIKYPFRSKGFTSVIRFNYSAENEKIILKKITETSIKYVFKSKSLNNSVMDFILETSHSDDGESLIYELNKLDCIINVSVLAKNSDSISG